MMGSMTLWGGEGRSFSKSFPQRNKSIPAVIVFSVGGNRAILGAVVWFDDLVVVLGAGAFSDLCFDRRHLPLTCGE